MARVREGHPFDAREHLLDGFREGLLTSFSGTRRRRLSTSPATTTSRTSRRATTSTLSDPVRPPSFFFSVTSALRKLLDAKLTRFFLFRRRADDTTNLVTGSTKTTITSAQDSVYGQSGNNYDTWTGSVRRLFFSFAPPRSPVAPHPLPHVVSTSRTENSPFSFAVLHRSLEVHVQPVGD